MLTSLVDQSLRGVACSGGSTGRQSGANGNGSAGGGGGGWVPNGNGIVDEDEDSDGPPGLTDTEEEVPRMRYSRPKNFVSAAAAPETQRSPAQHTPPGSLAQHIAGRFCAPFSLLMRFVVVSDILHPARPLDSIITCATVFTPVFVILKEIHVKARCSACTAMPREAAKGPEKEQEKPKAAKAEDRGKTSLAEDEGIGKFHSSQNSSGTVPACEGMGASSQAKPRKPLIIGPSLACMALPVWHLDGQYHLRLKPRKARMASRSTFVGAALLADAGEDSDEMDAPVPDTPPGARRVPQPYPGDGGRGGNAKEVRAALSPP